MILLAVLMMALVLVALLVFLYVAYPYRGRRVPRAGWLGETMTKGVERLPTLDNRR